MIKDLSLNEKLKSELARWIEDVYVMESIVIHDVQVTHAQDEGDCKKVFYSYERENGTEGRNSIYCDYCVDGQGNVVDFKEVHFNKEGERLCE